MGFPTPHSAVGVLTESRVSSSGRGQRRAESFWLISLLRVCKHLWTLQENRHVLSSPLPTHPLCCCLQKEILHYSPSTLSYFLFPSCPPRPPAPRNSVTRLAEGGEASVSSVPPWCSRGAELTDAVLRSRWSIEARCCRRRPPAPGTARRSAGRRTAGP